MSKRDGHEALHEVHALFPKSGAVIRRLFAEDETFRELCSDYAECAAVLDHLRRSEGDCLDRIEQYTELRVNLEQELLGRIAGPVGT